MFVARIVIFVLIFALLIWLLTSTAVIVHQGEVKVVESFGKFVRTLEPGLHFLIPIKSHILPLELLIRQSGQIFLIDGNSRAVLSWLDIVWKEI